jgi:hypothetical protein
MYIYTHLNHWNQFYIPSRNKCVKQRLRQKDLTEIREKALTEIRYRMLNYSLPALTEIRENAQLQSASSNRTTTYAVNFV